MKRFDGKTAVVTGAAQGIGRAICERLLEEGARGIIAVDLRADCVDDARCVPLVGDVSESNTASEAVRTCVERFGGIDVMVAHAGISEPCGLLDISDELWHRHMAVNVDGVFWCVREAARAMVSRGVGGAVVCTASTNAWHVEETMAAYNVTKAAVHAIARSAAIELGRSGIRVNAVAPGVVDTPLSAFVIQSEQLAPEYLRTIPLGRFAQPIDIANAVLYLSSEEASYVTGELLVIDGGQTLGIPVNLERANAQHHT